MKGTEEYCIVDLRPEWSRDPFIALWGPDSKGYQWSIAGAGRYARADVEAGPGYYSARKGRAWVRIAVPLKVVERLARPAVDDRERIDRGAMVLVNDKSVRAALIKARLRPGTAIAEAA